MNSQTLKAVSQALRLIANALENELEDLDQEAPAPEAAPAAPAPAPEAAPAPAPAPATGPLTVQDVHMRLGPLSQKLDEAGKQRLAQLIHGYGAANISSMDPVHFTDLLAKAEALVNG